MLGAECKHGSEHMAKGQNMLTEWKRQASVEGVDRGRQTTGNLI